MEVELTKRTIVREKYKGELRVGTKLHYYGIREAFIHRPIEGQVKEENGILVIIWDDGVRTKLDNSSESNDILRDCSFI
jgi:hypothetical protein